MSSDATVQLLTSIDATLKALVNALSQKNTFVGQGPAPATMAPTVDLDGKWGDPVIKSKPPRDWVGPDMMGKRMSECPPAYLDMVADRCEYFARKNDEVGAKDEKNGKPKSDYDRRDAAKARAWAARLRSGWTPKDRVEVYTGRPAEELVEDDGSIPFGG